MKLGPYRFLPEDNCIPILSENPKCIRTLRQKFNRIPMLRQKCIPNPFMFKKWTVKLTILDKSITYMY